MKKVIAFFIAFLVYSLSYGASAATDGRTERSVTLGDSYYNWSITLPVDTKIVSRSFNGSNTALHSLQGAFNCTIKIKKRTDAAIFSLNNSFFSPDIESDSVITAGPGVGEDNGSYYFWVKRKNKDKVREVRTYVGDVWIYQVELEEDMESSEPIDKEVFASFLDSFNIGFNQNANNIDLSNVSSAKTRVYTGNAQGWSIEIPAEWEPLQESEANNTVIFGNPEKEREIDEGSLSVAMFSKKEGLNLEKWVDEETVRMDDEYNSELVKMLERKSENVNGVSAISLLQSRDMGKRLEYVKTVYMMIKDYAYVLQYIVPESLYNNDILRQKVQEVIGSFRVNRSDERELGYLADVNRTVADDIYKKIEDESTGWSIKVPYSWTVNEDVDNNKTILSDRSGMIHVGMGTAKGVSLEQFSEYYENIGIRIAQFSGNFMNESIEVLNEKDTTVKKYTNSTNLSNNTYREQQYILEKNGYLYSFSILINNLIDSAKNKRILENIWKSAFFESF